MTGYIHDDIAEIMEDAASNKLIEGVRNNGASTDGWTEGQLKSLNIMLQYAWNRGYKSAYEDMKEQ